MTAENSQTTKRDIRLVAIDLDGTLLNNDHVMSERNRAAVKAVLDRGIQIVLATGKTRYGAADVLSSLNLSTPGIFSQGLIVYNADGGIRHQQTMDPVLIRRIVTFAEDRGFEMLAYSGNRLLVKTLTDRTRVIADFHEPMPEGVGPLVNILENTPINKLIAFGDEQKLRSLRWQLDKQLNGQVHLTTTTVQTQLEILPYGASKGRTFKALVNELGLRLEQTMAIGDGENDIEMIRAAGLGIAVDNANPRLKAVADEIVATNNEDGVAQALERFVLQNDSQKQEETAPTSANSETEASTEKSEEAES